MKYISIDLETTGLDARNNQILEFAAIIDDTECQLSYDECPKFHRIIKEPHDGFRGCAYALAMNVDLLKAIADQGPVPIGCVIIEQHHLLEQFTNWALDNGVNCKFNAAGKNFAGFDMKFLEACSKGWGQWLRRRYIDIGTMFVDWAEDEELPNLTECVRRATGDRPTNLHSALGDCWDVIKCVRVDVENKRMLSSLNNGLRQASEGEFAPNPYNPTSPDDIPF